MSKEDIIKRYTLDKDDGEVTIVPRNPIYDVIPSEDKPLRVAAYCRVSTMNEAQTSSYELQRNYYEDYITKHENWILVGIYADEGISGTSRKKRDEFNRMLQECFDGKIDYIVTKGIHRFSRNSVDCLSVVRELRQCDPPVGVLFEIENLDTLRNNDYELYLTIMAAFSQEESHTKSESILWSLEKRFRDKNFLCPTNALLGYEKEDGKMVIEPEGAKTVRLIYDMFLAGYSCSYIAHILTIRGRPTGKGNPIWSYGSVLNILKNERYCGAIVAQKTFTKSFLTHETAKNKGQKQAYYKPGHHPAIVTMAEHRQALLLLSSNRVNGSRLFGNWTLTVVRKGLLSGFIPINRAFGGYEAAHYVQASNSIKEDLPVGEISVPVIPGCQVVRTQEFVDLQAAMVSITRKEMRFNKACVKKLPYIEFAEILLHPLEKLLAIRPTDERNYNAIRWNQSKDGTPQPPKISCAAFCRILFDLMGWGPSWNIRLTAVCLSKNDENILMFDLREAEFHLLQDIPYCLDTHSRRRKIYHPPTWADNFGVSMEQYKTTCRMDRAMLLTDWHIDAPGEPAPGFEPDVVILTEEDIRRKIDDLGAAI